MLGTLWTRQDIEALKASDSNKGGKSSQEDIFIPLALGINPKLTESLISMISDGISTGAYTPGPGEEVVEMNKADFEDVYKMQPKQQ